MCSACTLIGAFSDSDSVDTSSVNESDELAEVEESEEPAEEPEAVPEPTPEPEPEIVAPGKGTTYADALFNEVNPTNGENLSDNGGEELFVRTIDAGHSHPNWNLSILGIDHDFETGVRTFWYDFADGSRITFYAEPSGAVSWDSAEGGEGLTLTRVEVSR